MNRSIYKRIRETYLTLADEHNSRYALVDSSLGFEEVESVNKVIDNFIKMMLNPMPDWLLKKSSKNK